jgi:hypothetical protein
VRRPLIFWLRGARVVIGVTALVGLFVPAAAVAAVALVVGVPLARLAWLIVRWWRVRDTRFVLAGLALAAVISAGTAVASVG